MLPEKVEVVCQAVGAFGKFNNEAIVQTIINDF